VGGLPWTARSPARRPPLLAPDDIPRLRMPPASRTAGQDTVIGGEKTPCPSRCRSGPTAGATHASRRGGLTCRLLAVLPVGIKGMLSSSRDAPCSLSAPHRHMEEGGVRPRLVCAWSGRYAQRMLNHELTILGTATWRSTYTPFGIKRRDRRLPLYILGKTGMGKSTLLMHIVLSDIRAGAGVAVIDPHGALVEAILDYIPDARIEDVIYVNATDTERPVPLNPGVSHLLPMTFLTGL
jgi:hypothetical protein